MAHLSEVFKHISHFRRHGHQIGRKIGDMLEVMTLGAIYSVPELKSRLHIEPKLFGFSEAGHKVEFAILKDEAVSSEPYVSGGEIRDPGTLLAFIECKKVGVEQTVNAKFKKSFAKHDKQSFKIPFGSKFEVSFAPRNCERVSYILELSNSGEIKVYKENQEVLLEQASGGHRIIFTFGVDGESNIIGNLGSLRDLPYKVRFCKVFEVMSVHTMDGYLAGTLNDCLTGPQTPEKAKQASFVALDVRKRRTGSFDKEDNPADCKSVLVLTEFSHWEKKSQNMIKACIDVNMVVPDEFIVEAFQIFEKHFDANNFLDKMTKDSFFSDNETRDLILKLIKSKNNKIFYDLGGETLKELAFQNNRVIFV